MSWQPVDSTIARERSTEQHSVVRAITRLNIGGPARQALLLTRALAGQFPTTLVAGTPPAHEGELLDPAVPVHRVPLVRPVEPVSDVRALRALRRVLRAQRPAILHTHMAKAGTLGRIAARSLGGDRPRTVHTFHGHVLEGYFSRPAERTFVEVERHLARSTDVLLAVSPEIRDELVDLRIGRSEQYHVIPLGLELAPFLDVDRPSGRLRQSLAIGDDVPLVGVVGRLVAVKAVDVLIEAMASVPKAHLVVVGDGEERSALERLVYARSLAGRVHFTGWCDDVPSVISDLDVVALSSRNEGTPVALIEALAAARPVVATHVGGVAHVVVPDETGLLVPPGDPGALARALRTVLEDRRLAVRLAAAGRAHAAAEFGARRLIDDIRALYLELSTGRAPGQACSSLAGAWPPGRSR